VLSHFSGLCSENGGVFSETSARTCQLHVRIAEDGNFCNYCLERLKSQSIICYGLLPDDTTGVHCNFSLN